MTSMSIVEFLVVELLTQETQQRPYLTRQAVQGVRARARESQGSPKSSQESRGQANEEDHQLPSSRDVSDRRYGRRRRGANH